MGHWRPMLTIRELLILAVLCYKDYFSMDFFALSGRHSGNDYLDLSFSYFIVVAEFLGEKLAAFFGITTPRYQYVIDEFYRLKEQVSGNEGKNIQ